jgi:hypothetical protein
MEVMSGYSVVSFFMSDLSVAIGRVIRPTIV